MDKKNIIFVTLLLTSIPFLSGCATFVAGARFKSFVVSYPQNAHIFRDGIEIGITPARVKLERKSSSPIVLKKAGYPEKEIQLTRKFNYGIFLNFLNPYGYLIDVLLGSEHTFKERAIVTDYLPLEFQSDCKKVTSFTLQNDSKNEITWKTEKNLAFNDFEGRSDKKMRNLFAGATTSKIIVEYLYDDSSAKIFVVNKFDKQNSFIAQKSFLNRQVLKHEQLHFNISELFARMLREKIASGTFTNANFADKLGDISKQITRDVYAFQASYDNDVYNRPGNQNRWNKKVSELINQLAGYENNIVVVKLY